MNFFKKRRLKNQEITPKGECFYDYCLKIRNGEWTEKDYIEAYEKNIEEMRIELTEKSKFEYSRENIAYYTVEVMNEVREANK